MIEKRLCSSLLILFPLHLVASHAPEVVHFLLDRGEVVFEFAYVHGPAVDGLLAKPGGHLLPCLLVVTSQHMFACAE